MTLVMDGVLGGGVVRARSHKRAVPITHPAQSLKATASAELRLGVGMDGLRRASGTLPNPAIAKTTKAAAPQISTTQRADLPAIPQMPLPVEMALPQKARLPVIGDIRNGQKRVAVTAACATLALVVSMTAVRVLSTPRSSTASAEAAAPHVTSSPVVPGQTKASLQPLISTFGAGEGSNFGIVVTNLKTGETASLNPNQQMESASLYKLFVAQRIYQRIDLGQLQYDDQAGGGSADNIGQCLAVMISISDNTCGRALGTILNWGAQDEALDAEGYANTDLATPQQTSAADVSKLMESLYKGTLLSPDSTQRFLSLLKDQKVNNRLPTGLPEGTVIAHKTGDLDNFVHDAGIVYGPKTDYLVVVLSGPWNSPADAPAAFTNLSQKLWNYFEQ